MKTCTEGEHWVVFEEEERVVGSVLHLGENLKLLGESVLVGYSTEGEELQGNQFTVCSWQLAD